MDWIAPFVLGSIAGFMAGLWYAFAYQDRQNQKAAESMQTILDDIAPQFRRLD